MAHMNRIILIWILEKQYGRAWMGVHLAQDKGQWRAVVNKVMNLN
jgi:hypothetical protein